MPETPTLVARVLALDISTSVCGAVLVHVFEDGAVKVLNFDAINATAQRATDRRIATLRDQGAEMERFCRIRIAALNLRLIAQPGDFDHIAYEVPNQRGAGATAGLWQAIGAILERLQPTVPVPLIRIHASTAKAVVGTQAKRATGESASSLGEKAAAIHWAQEMLSGQADAAGQLCRLSSRYLADQEAIADAVAVAVATVPILLPGVQAPCDRRKSLPKAKARAKRVTKRAVRTAVVA